MKTWHYGALFLAFNGICYWALTRRKNFDEPTPRAPFSARVAGTRQLASALAAGDTAAMRDFEQRLAASTQDEDASLYDLLYDTFLRRHLLGAIDHRSGEDETISQVDPMLVRFGIRNFDWSFIEILLRYGDGTEMRNCNFLTLLRDRLAAAHDLVFFSIDAGDDSFQYGIVRSVDFPAIADLVVPDEFEVRIDFGPDEAYVRGKAILAQHAASGD